MPPSTSDSLRVRVHVAERVPVGQSVPIALHVENVTDRALTLYLVGREIAFDLIVEEAEGAILWRRLEGEVIQSILRLETLPPGETLVLEDSWDQRSNAGALVAPGEYTVRGELLTEGDAVPAPAEPLRILPP